MKGLGSKVHSAKLHFIKLKLNRLLSHSRFAAQLSGSSHLTIVTFIIVIRRCAALLNSRPIAILLPSLADPVEILSVSPSSLAGPSSSTWKALGAARHYAGQQALIQAHLKRFQSKWKTRYTNRLYSNSNMATCSALEETDVVLITDLANNSGRSIHPALGWSKQMKLFLPKESVSAHWLRQMNKSKRVMRNRSKDHLDQMK